MTVDLQPQMKVKLIVCVLNNGQLVLQANEPDPAACQSPSGGAWSAHWGALTPSTSWALKAPLLALEGVSGSIDSGAD